MEYRDGVVVMDLVDLEHCGFNHDDFDFQLHTYGIDENEARFPVALLVNFAGGHIMYMPAADSVIEKHEEARRIFQWLRACVFGEEMTEDQNEADY